MSSCILYYPGIGIEIVVKKKKGNISIDECGQSSLQCFHLLMFGIAGKYIGLISSGPWVPFLTTVFKIQLWWQIKL